MGKNIGRIAGSLAATVALAVGVLGLVPIYPKWAWIGLGIAGLVLIVVQAMWEHRGDGEHASSVEQKQKGGAKSTNNQAGRDVNINQPPSEGRQ